MNWLDLLLLISAVSFALSGYRQGFVVGVLAFAGFIGGGIIGTVLAPALVQGLNAGLGQSLLAWDLDSSVGRTRDDGYASASFSPQSATNPLNNISYTLTVTSRANEVADLPDEGRDDPAPVSAAPFAPGPEPEPEPGAGAGASGAVSSV